MVVGGGKTRHQSHHHLAVARCDIGLGGVLWPFGENRARCLQCLRQAGGDNGENLVDLRWRGKTTALQRSHAGLFASCTCRAIVCGKWESKTLLGGQWQSLRQINKKPSGSKSATIYKQPQKLLLLI